MTEPRSTHEAATLDNAPAVGFHVTETTESEVVPATILRARGNDHEVIVTYSANGDREAVAFADTLGATIVDVDTNHRDVDPRMVASSTARAVGYPGLLWLSDPSAKIDFQSSRRDLADSSTYWTPAVVSNDGQDAGLVVGIPAYNESVSIGSTVIQAKNYASRVIVVEDGSQDATAEIARAAGATVIEHETNRGKGAAIETLFDSVRTENLDALVLLDGDGQHLPADIPRITEPVLEDGHDLVIGSRYKDGHSTETPLYRRFGQRVLDALTLGSTRIDLTDTQSGFRALSPEAVSRINVQTNGMGIESQMIFSAVNERLDIREVPIDVRYDGIDGQTFNPVKHGLSVFSQVVREVRDRHPLLVFGPPGVGLLSLGSLLAIHTLVGYEVTGTLHQWRLFVGAVTAIIGLLSAFSGLLLSQISNIVSKEAGD